MNKSNMRKFATVSLAVISVFILHSCRNADQSKESPSLIPDTISDADHTRAAMPADTAAILPDSLEKNSDTSQNTMRTND